LLKVRAARAKDPAILKAPGGDTGFVTVTLRQAGQRVPVILHIGKQRIAPDISCRTTELNSEPASLNASAARNAGRRSRETTARDRVKQAPLLVPVDPADNGPQVSLIETGMSVRNRRRNR
jgi:hypothetical protein